MRKIRAQLAGRGGVEGNDHLLGPAASIVASEKVLPTPRQLPLAGLELLFVTNHKVAAGRRDLVAALTSAGATVTLLFVNSRDNFTVPQLSATAVVVLHTTFLSHKTDDRLRALLPQGIRIVRSRRGPGAIAQEVAARLAGRAA